MTSQELSNLHLGDVIFARAKTPQSWLVRKITKSKWSHVAFYIGDGMVLDIDGFQAVNRHSLSDFEEWTVRRYPNLSGVQWSKIYYYINAQIGKPYDWKQIAGFLLEYVFKYENRWQTKGHFSCGKLLDKGFLHARINLVPSKTDGDVTPEDLLESPLLIELPK